MRSWTMIIVVAVASCLFHAREAGASWPVAGRALPHGGYLQPMIADGSGGVFIASRVDSAIVIDHFDGNGDQLAGSAPVPATPGVHFLVSDGGQGFYLAWTAFGGPAHRVHLARYSDPEHVVWSTSVFEPRPQNDQTLKGLEAGLDSDVYVGIHESTADGSIRIIRFRHDGERSATWPAQDVVARGRLLDSGWIEADGTGGVIAQFHSDGLLAYRFDSLGAQVWTWESPSYERPRFQTVPATHGGTFLQWITPERRIRLTLLGNDGITAAGWPDSGIDVACAAPSGIDEVSVCSDSTGGIYVVWPVMMNTTDLYAQHFRGDGSVAPGWEPCGNLVSGAPRYQDDAVCISDGTGGVVIIWQDWRYSRSSGSIEPFAVRLAGDGSLIAGWSPGGLSIASPTHVDYLSAVPDGTGGAVVAWEPFHYLEPGGLQRVRGDGVYGPLMSQSNQRSIRIFPAWPNPFETHVSFVIELSNAEPLSVAIRDVMGRRVVTLKHPDVQHAGPHTIRWNGVDEGGSPAHPGVYFIDVHTRTGTRSKRIVKIQDAFIR